MERADVIAVLSDGHGVLAQETAREVCRVVGVLYPEQLVIRWESAQEALDRFGFFASEEGPGTGIDTLDFSYYVTRALGLVAPGTAYTGRGFQAQANARAVAAHLRAMLGE